MTDEGKSKIESYYVKHYYSQSVSESGGYRYFGVSDAIVPVGEGKGIWYVQPSGEVGTSFSQTHRPHNSLFASIPVGKAIADTFWRFGNIATNRQIVLSNVGDSPFKDVRTVDYGVVRSFSSYSDTEEVVVPDGRYDLLMEMTTAWLGGVYNDKSNNNQ